MTSSKIKIHTGDNISAPNAAWSFSGEACSHFDVHARHSIPLYTMGHDLICSVSDFFIKDGSIAYDLGCSIGELIDKLATHNNHKNTKWIGIDIEKDMIQHAQALHQESAHVQFILSDILNYDFEKSDFITAYYTVQFIAPKFRQMLIDQIYERLHWGGAFVMFEKVRGPDARFQDILTSLYTDFKLDQGYQPDEIIAKSRSLKGILEPFSTQGNLDMLKRAGFVDMITILRHTCFEGYLAIK